MSSLNVNTALTNLLVGHGIEVQEKDEFVYPDLPIAIKLKAQSFYREVNGHISSQLDISIITPDGTTITESFGDFGANLDEALSKNFQNFALNSFHTLLVAFGCDKQEVLGQVDLEKWDIDGKLWNVYVGTITFKAIGSIESNSVQTDHFYYAVEKGILSQNLSNNIHWFRGFYAQHKDKISITEFLVDNNSSTAIDSDLYAIPFIPNIEFCSCRIFVFLRPDM
jgi:hypothetical protein